MSFNNVNVNVCGGQNIIKALQNYNTVILKPNIVDNRNVLTQEMMSERHTKYVIRWNYSLEGATINVPEDCIIEFAGGTIDNGTIVGNNTILMYSKPIDEVCPAERQGTFIYNTTVADEEDITSETGQLKFKDKAYNPDAYSGLAKRILRKNMVNGVNMLTQEMVSATNTIYVIQYDFTLSEDITVPANCVLKFDGGSISGNVIVLSSNTKILGNGKIYCPHSVVYPTANKDLIKVQGSNVEIRDIEVYSDVTFGYDTSGTEQNMIIGIQAYNGTNITIKDVKLHNLSAAIGVDTCNEVKITNCYIDKCFCRHRNIYGYGIVPNHSSNVVIDGNILNNIERHAIYVTSDNGRGENIIISNNIINGLVKDSYFDYEFMIKIMSASNVIVNSNTINGCRGIMLNPEYYNGRDIKICNNKITTISRILAVYPNDKDNNVYIFNIIDFENNNTYIENIAEAFVLGCANQINIYNNTILCRNTNNDNYCFRFKETTEEIEGVVVPVNVNKISFVKCIGNKIRNFNAYAHLSNITNFYADDFIDWSSGIQVSPRPTERIENVDYDRTKLTELSVYSDYYTQDNRNYYHGLTYYKREFGKDISYNGTNWVDATGTPV